MSIASEITRITGNIASAYTAVSGKGGTLPAAKNSANLPAAIESIPSGGGTLITKSITENGTYNASDDGADGYSSVSVNVSGGGGAIFAIINGTDTNSITLPDGATSKNTIRIICDDWISVSATNYSLPISIYSIGSDAMATFLSSEYVPWQCYSIPGYREDFTITIENGVLTIVSKSPNVQNIIFPSFGYFQVIAYDET